MGNESGSMARLTIWREENLPGMQWSVDIDGENVANGFANTFATARRNARAMLGLAYSTVGRWRMVERSYESTIWTSELGDLQ